MHVYNPYREKHISHVWQKLSLTDAKCKRCGCIKQTAMVNERWQCKYFMNGTTFFKAPNCIEDSTNTK
jgi:hypothetical protein